MRIKTQFIFTMALFASILVIVATSALMTNRLIEQADRQERIAAGIAQGAGELGYLSNDYLIYREEQQLKRWQSRFAAFSGQVAALEADTPEKQFLVANIRTSRDRMKEVFDSAASAVPGHPPGNQGSVINSMAFIQVSWSRMAVQTQALAADALRLSQLLSRERERLADTRTLLMYVMIGLFGAFLLASYMLTYRRILKSMAKLQAGAAVIGSGNLDFSVEDGKNDEMGELSHAFNRMTTDLKAVTASKVDLEREIIERKCVEDALRVSEEIYRDLFNNITEEVHFWKLVHNENGQITNWRLVDANPATLITWGKTLDEIKGKTTDEIFGPGASEHYMAVVRKIMAEGVPFSFEDYFPHLDKYFQFTSIPLRDYFITTGIDITEIKKALKLAEQNQRKLETTNKEMESFSYSVSHDLRSPLRAIDGYSRMILKKQENCFDAETKRQFQVIRNNVGMMGQLIDDLLTFSRLGKQEVTKANLGMDELIREVWEELVLINPSRSMVLNMGPMAAAQGDRTLIRQVYSNLLGNAVKFTRGRDTAVIEAGSCVQGGETVYYVRDNGIGFDMQYHDKLFGVFQRLHRADEYEGTGIGLAVVQRIIVRHGGRVWAEGEVDKGATFYFSLPISARMMLSH